MQVPIALMFKIWSGSLTLFGISLMLFFLKKFAFIKSQFDSEETDSLIPMDLEFLVSEILFSNKVLGGGYNEY